MILVLDRWVLWCAIVDLCVDLWFWWFFFIFYFKVIHQKVIRRMLIRRLDIRRRGILLQVLIRRRDILRLTLLNTLNLLLNSKVAVLVAWKAGKIFTLSFLISLSLPVHDVVEIGLELSRIPTIWYRKLSYERVNCCIVW